jgi:TorA maturation chaperone TorD
MTQATVSATTDRDAVGTGAVDAVDTADLDNLKSLMSMREGIYRLFASLYFKELTDEQIQFLHDTDLSGLAELNDHMAAGVHDIKHALHRINSGTREDLAVDYAHTFLAAGSTKDENRACPYESVFTSRDGLLMQEARDQVYRYMLNEHLEPDQSLHIPEDHLSFVFEFMADLCKRFNEAVDAGDADEALRLFNVQHAFFDEHIANWIDRFCDAIEDCCHTALYRGVSEMTRGFMQMETSMFEEVASALESGR